MRHSEEAVEYDELTTFLRLNESYDSKVEDDRPLLPQVPVGVPGAASPAQMTPEHHKPKTFPSSPSDSSLRGKPANKREGEFDVSTELEGFGLQGVRVTQDDLAALVEELGLGGHDADELVKSLSGPGKKEEAVKVSDPKAKMMAELSAKVKTPAEKTKLARVPVKGAPAATNAEAEEMNGTKRPTM
jgi:SH3 domain-binding glutamic acid-rich protein